MGITSYIDKSFFLFIGVAVISWSFGFSSGRNVGTQELLEYQAKVNAETIKREAELKKLYEVKVKENESTLNDINSRFEQLLNTDIVHNTSSTDSVQMPDNPDGIKDKQCKRFRDDSKKFQRLYEQQLEVARQCDIQIAKCLKVQELFE